jgi:hypothetical protein
MRYSSVLMVSLALMPAYAYSQQPLQDQISAVANAEADQKSTEDAARKAAVAAQKEREAKEQVLRGAAIADHNARVAKDEALQEAEKKREQSYEDNLRQIQLDSMKMDLDAKKAKVSRTNEYIDQDLKAKAAMTDVVQSNADATRNITTGMKDKMESEGKAQEKQAKGFWDF